MGRALLFGVCIRAPAFRKPLYRTQVVALPEMLTVVAYLCRNQPLESSKVGKL